MTDKNSLYISNIIIQVHYVNLAFSSRDKYQLHAYLFTRENIRKLFSLVINKHPKESEIKITKLVLNLGAIPSVHFASLFNQRLMQAFSQCLTQLATQEHIHNIMCAHAMSADASAGLADVPAGLADIPVGLADVPVGLVDIPVSLVEAPVEPTGAPIVSAGTSVVSASASITSATPNELLMSVESHPEVLKTLAIYCLQPVILLNLLQNGQPYYLRKLLKRLLQEGDKHSFSSSNTYYSRVTTSRLGIAALSYLLRQSQEYDWLSQNASTASQVTDWTKAIAQGEILPEQLVQLLTGNRSTNSVLIGQHSYSPLIVMRWLLPLWQQLAVRQVIRRLKGGRGVQQIDTYLSRCLQQQGNHVVREDAGIQTDSPQVVLSRDNATLRRDKEMPTISRRMMQSRKNSLREPNESLSSNQSISNAGLLLLWPLLPQFFSQLELRSEHQFFSDIARWQAIYCLDRLVWGEDNPIAERLTLNKLLCGVSSLEIEQPTYPLSILQLQQIDGWLAGIGSQLPGWQKLSLNDIRQLFLQRMGEINMDGIFPQIIVKAEPYDFLLRDWPWPMTLASFPWIEQPLNIAWPIKGFTE